MSSPISRGSNSAFFKPNKISKLQGTAPVMKPTTSAIQQADSGFSVSTRQRVAERFARDFDPNNSVLIGNQRELRLPL